MPCDACSAARGLPLGWQRICVFLWAGLAANAILAQSRPDPFVRARERLIEQDLLPAGITEGRVLQVLRDTPRHEFVPLAQRKLAYLDMALPIGDQQTISSPFIVAFMTQSLDPQPTDRVLEIGTGSGYQAAVLSPLVAEVYSIEIVPTLGQRAERLLKRLKYDNVHVRIGDGFAGWPDKAPFDKIIVTCSPEAVPEPLVAQLGEGGSMIVPVGERYQQTLYRFTKQQGTLQPESLRPTLFVPMTGVAESRRNVQPDLAEVRIVNGDFEDTTDDHDQLPGWYYQRQVDSVRDDGAPEGQAYVRFSNITPGLASHALQGLAVDGERFREIEVSARVKWSQVVEGPEGDMLPSVAVSFYDTNRTPLGQQWLGPWSGSGDWSRVAHVFRVPRKAKEAILRIGLFGATGEFCVDDIRLVSRPR